MIQGDYELSENLLKNLDRWRAVEVMDGIGTLYANVLKDLPYDLDPERALWSEHIHWKSSVFRAIVTPTRDSVPDEWIQLSIEPPLLVASPYSLLSTDEQNDIRAHYTFVGKVKTSAGDEGDILYTSIVGPEARHNSFIVIFEALDIQTAFQFDAGVESDEQEVLKAVSNPLSQIASNLLSSPVMHVMGASQRAAKSANDLAFELSMFGSAVPEGSTPFHITKGLDEGWTLYAHNGGNSIIEMLDLTIPTFDTEDFKANFAPKIFEIPRDENGNQVFGWRDEGIQLLLAPPANVDTEGMTPLLFSIHVSASNETAAYTKDYDVIHQDDPEEGIYGGVTVLAFSPVEEEGEDEVERFAHTYLGVVNDLNCSVSGILVSTGEKAPEFYDEAFVIIARNLGVALMNLVQPQAE